MDRAGNNSYMYSPQRTADASLNLQKPTATETPTSSATSNTGTPTPIVCGGFSVDPVQCPDGQICKTPPSSICFDGSVADCTGICVGQPCGGFVFPPLPPCPQGQVCARRPSSPPADLVPDLGGICVFESLTCGASDSSVPQDGCPTDWGCVDFEGDSCSPNTGDEDCQGVCSFNATVRGDAGGDGAPPES